ncbi:MAG: NAD(+) diphosphatase, partial [Acidobacteriota bacterium]|nr:NAD(+) diphosphatase [Acidobacteriota bacterium]
PGPCPASLRLGFAASAERSSALADPVPQAGEMVEVRWFGLTQIREAARRSDGQGVGGRASGELQLPGEVSIARGLIEAWVARGGRRLA